MCGAVCVCMVCVCAVCVSMVCVVLFVYMYGVYVCGAVCVRVVDAGFGYGIIWGGGGGGVQLLESAVSFCQNNERKDTEMQSSE